MNAVTNLRPVASLESFLDFLYRNETGYVYAPTKSLDLNNKSDSKGAWDKRFFRWPQQRRDLIEHIEKNRKSYDVYLAPALFTKPFGRDAESIECVKGTFTYWVDFDGNAPNESILRDANAPFPSWRNCSSTEGHEHWFWSSPTFITNIADIQDTNKALTYALDGDKGGWYAHKVLRPVSGINHKRTGEEVTIIARNERHYTARDFEKIPIPNYHFTETDYNPHKTPPWIDVIAKHQITDPDFLALIKKGEMPEGSRSSALSKFAMYCAEHGMDNHEIYSMVSWKDTFWKKFAEREDKIKQYAGLVNYARNKYGQKATHITNERFKVYGYMDAINYVDATKWLIKGILPETGLLIVAGRSGSQKTTLVTDICRQLALGKARLDWKSEIEEPLRIFMLSMEMPVTELREFLAPGAPEDPAEQILLNQNFVIHDEIIKFYDVGKSDEDPSRQKIKDLIAYLTEYKPHIVIVDSATVAVASDANSSKEVQAALNLLKDMRQKLTFAAIVIAHTRKDPPKSGYREKDLDDLFGAQNLAAAASAVMGIQKEQDKDGKETGFIDVKYLKTRFSGSNEKFQIKFDPKDFSFYRPAISMPGAAPVVNESPVAVKEKPEPKKDNGGGKFLPL